MLRRSIVSDAFKPLDCSPLGSSVLGFSRQEYWSGLPSPTPGDLPNSRIEPMSPGSPALQVDSLPVEPFRGRWGSVIRKEEGWTSLKSLPANSGNTGSIPGLERSHIRGSN